MSLAFWEQMGRVSKYILRKPIIFEAIEKSIQRKQLKRAG